MKVCIPIKEYQGFESPVYGHIGSAPAFFVYDTSEDTFSVLDNKSTEHVHGQCNPLNNFRDNPIDVMISEGIGIRALQKLNHAGVQVLKIKKGLSIKDTLELLESEELEARTLEDACAHHR
jgi:predicted Fe-Mo cluster-binding NifX family protein